MTVHSASDIVSILEGNGFDPAGTAIGTAIVLAESGGDDQAFNSDSNGTNDRGMWQINSVHIGARYTPPGGVARQLSDDDRVNPGISTGYAWALSHNGTVWGSWTTYMSGAYRSHLTDANTAVAEGGGNVSPGGLIPTPWDFAGTTTASGIAGDAVKNAVLDPLTAFFGPVLARISSALINGGLVIGGVAVLGFGLYLAAKMLREQAPAMPKSIGRIKTYAQGRSFTQAAV